MARIRSSRHAKPMKTEEGSSSEPPSGDDDNGSGDGEGGGGHRDAASPPANTPAPARIAGTCDICANRDGFNGHVLRRCNDCGVSVHEACYGLMSTAGLGMGAQCRGFRCHACKAVGREFRISRPRDALKTMEQGERPSECVLCSIKTGVHAMHPLYDTHGPRGVQRVLPANKMRGVPRRLAWVHTLCASYLCVHQGSVFGCFEDGSFEKGDDTEEGEEEDEEDEEDGYGVEDEDAFGAKVVASPSSEVAVPETENTTHHYVIITEKNATGKVWMNVAVNTKLLRKMVRCEICKHKDDRMGAIRIPVQCSAGGLGENPDLAAYRQSGHPVGAQGKIRAAENCLRGMHVGCARWGPRPAVTDRRVFFFAGITDADLEGAGRDRPQANCYCHMHAKALREGKHRAKKDRETARAARRLLLDDGDGEDDNGGKKIPPRPPKRGNKIRGDLVDFIVNDGDDDYDKLGSSISGAVAGKRRSEERADDEKKKARTARRLSRRMIVVDDSDEDEGEEAAPMELDSRSSETPGEGKRGSNSGGEGRDDGNGVGSQPGGRGSSSGRDGRGNPAGPPRRGYEKAKSKNDLPPEPDQAKEAKETSGGEGSKGESGAAPAGGGGGGSSQSPSKENHPRAKKADVGGSAAEDGRRDGRDGKEGRRKKRRCSSSAAHSSPRGVGDGGENDCTVPTSSSSSKGMGQNNDINLLREATTDCAATDAVRGGRRKKRARVASSSPAVGGGDKLAGDDGEKRCVAVPPFITPDRLAKEAHAVVEEKTVIVEGLCDICGRSDGYRGFNMQKVGRAYLSFPRPECMWHRLCSGKPCGAKILGPLKYPSICT